MVKTYLKEVSGKGIGLFAEEEIEEGTVVCQIVPYFDIYFTQEQVDSLDEIQKDFIYKYACRKKDGRLLLHSSNERFINHSDNPNIAVNDKEQDIACRRIEKDEEILIDYRTICEDEKENLTFKTI